MLPGESVFEADVTGRMVGAGRLLGQLSVLWFVLACTGSGDVEVAREPANGDDAGADSGTGADSGGPSGEAGPVDAGEDPFPDAAVAPLRLGVVPLPRAPDDTPVGPAEQTLAHLEVLAVGSRGITLARRWDELYSDLETPRAEAWVELSNTATLYAEAGRTLLLCISFVDRRLDARPPGASANWYAIENRVAAEALIDQIFLTFGDGLRYLTIGSEIDRWLAQADSSTRSAFTEFVRHTLRYAHDHPERPESLQIGVTASRQGWVGGVAELGALRVDSDVVVATYFPLDARSEARSPSNSAPDLDELIEAVSADGEAPPILLQEVGYPSSFEVGSSEPIQQLFFESFFQALGSRRGRIPFANVYALNEPAPLVCEQTAIARGLAADARAIAAWCSLGLRDRAGAPKPAWDTVAEGLATFALP